MHGHTYIKLFKVVSVTRIILQITFITSSPKMRNFPPHSYQQQRKHEYLYLPLWINKLSYFHSGF